MAETGAPKGGGKLLSGNRKWYVYGAGAGGLILVFYFRKRSQANASAATTGTGSTGTTDTSGYDPYSYQDTSGGYSGVYGTTPSYYGQYGYTGAGPSTVPASNAQWAQQAAQYLTGQGYDPITTTAALGVYLYGGGLTDNQYQIVQAAIAFEGYPPTPPPAPHVNPPVGQSGGGGGTTPGKPLTGVFIHNIVTQAIYEVDDANKVKYYMTFDTWNKLGKAHERPHVIDVLPNDPRLKYSDGGNL